jgi:hypothetical protein
MGSYVESRRPAVAAPVVRQRAIIFSAPMVLALLNGTKTQTRRLVKKPPTLSHHYLQPMFGKGTDGQEIGEPGLWREVGPDYPDDERDDRRCPYGTVGDLLWVKETWCPADKWADDTERDDPTCIRYRADGKALRFNYVHQGAAPTKIHGTEQWTDPAKWNSPLFLPRWASRITLEVKSIRAERLHDITEEDANAEGVRPGQRWADSTYPPRSAEHRYKVSETHREAYARAWNTIHGNDAWRANPWIWAIEFTRVEASCAR